MDRAKVLAKELAELNITSITDTSLHATGFGFKALVGRSDWT